MNKSNFHKGLFFMLMAMLVSVSNDVVAKFMGQRLTTFEIIFFRFFFGLITLLPFAISDGLQVFKTKHLAFNIARGIFGVLSFFLYTYSVVHLPLVEVTTIMWAIPLFSIALSIFFLKEKVSCTRWVATLIGFIGLSFVSLYGSEASISLKLMYAAPIASALLFASQDILIKKIVNKDEKKTTTLLYFSIIASIITIVPALFDFVAPTAYEYFLLILLGAGSNLIQYFILKSYSLVDLSVIAPFRYLEFLICVLFAFIFFSEIPGLNVLFGALILIPSNLYLTYSENKKAN